MADMKQFGNAFLKSLGRVATNPNVFHSVVGIARGFAQEGLKKTDLSPDARAILHQLADGAEEMAVAALQGTQAAAEVPKEAAAKAQPTIEKAVETVRNENPGGAG